MSFISKKKFRATSLTNIKTPEGYSRINSFNNLALLTGLLNEKTKVVIVGTLTPPNGIKNGFFYCAKNNNQLKYIDDAINFKKPDGYSLDKEREALINCKKDREKGIISSPRSTEIIDNICKILKERHIGLLDVVQEAIQSDNDRDYEDDKIKAYVLDRESFFTLKDINPDVVFIANSGNARNALDCIISEMQVKDPKWYPRVHTIPQQLRGKNAKGKSVQKDIIEELAKHI